MTYYKYTFTDGYQCVARGMSKNELAHAELKHGKLINKVKE